MCAVSRANSAAKVKQRLKVCLFVCFLSVCIIHIYKCLGGEREREYGSSRYLLLLRKSIAGVESSKSQHFNS